MVTPPRLTFHFPLSHALSRQRQARPGSSALALSRWRIHGSNHLPVQAILLTHCFTLLSMPADAYWSSTSYIQAPVQQRKSMFSKHVILCNKRLIANRPRPSNPSRGLSTTPSADLRGFAFRVYMVLPYGTLLQYLPLPPTLVVISPPQVVFPTGYLHHG